MRMTGFRLIMAAVPALAVSLALSGCASVKRAADGTPLEYCDGLGTCTPFTAAEQENYHRYHLAYEPDHQQCASRTRWRLQTEQEDYRRQARQNLRWGCGRDKECLKKAESKYIPTPYDFRSYETEADYKLCMTQHGWKGTGDYGWRYGRAGAPSPAAMPPAAVGGTSLPW